MMYRNTIIGFSVGILILIGEINFVLAAPVYDHVVGTYTDDLSDATGLLTQSGAKVNTTSTIIQLVNESGGFTTPFNSSGYVITQTIVPQLMSRWLTFTFTAVTPTSTSYKVQILDGASHLYPDEIIPGNSVGFSSSSVDVSVFSVDAVAASTSTFVKQPGMRIKITLSTTDTNNTPEISALLLTWQLRSGDVSASVLANTAMPTTAGDRKLNLLSPSSGANPYLVPRWSIGMKRIFACTPILGSDQTLYVKNMDSATVVENPFSFAALNKNTGDVIWSKQTTYGDCDLALSANGTLYTSDYSNDTMWAYDANTGAVKWGYNLVSGHANLHATIGPSGTIYTIHGEGSSAHNTRIQAFNPDGTKKWTQEIDRPDALIYDRPSVGIGDDGVVYLTTAGNAAFVYQNTGRLYALNPDDGSINWFYPSGDNAMGPLIGGDNTIYTAAGACDGCDSTQKKVYAINSDGSLKWETSISTSTEDTISSLVLRPDNVLLVFRSVGPWTPVVSSSNGYVDAINATSGAILWTKTIPQLVYSGILSPPHAGQTNIVDSSGGFYVSTANYVRGWPWTTSSSSLVYFDSDANEKFKLTLNQNAIFHGFSLDTNGYLFGNHVDYKAVATGTLFAMVPWTIIPSISPSTVNPGDTVTFSVTTSMPQTNILSGNTNKAQIILEDGTKLPLIFSTTTVSLDSIWTATTSFSGIANGTHNYTVEAGVSDVITDIPVHFDDSAVNTGGTGLVSTSTFVYNKSISNFSVSVGTSDATVFWTTDEDLSTQVDYGETTSYGYSTLETDTPVRVKNHSVYISNLRSCIKYYLSLISKDSSGNTAVGSYSFSTTGCLGGSSVTYLAPYASPIIATSSPSSIFSITINNGINQITSRTVSLSLYGGIDAKTMVISENSNFNFVEQVPYSTSTTFDLSDGFGTKTLYARFYNTLGTASPVVSSTIIYGSPLTSVTTLIDEDNISTRINMLRRRLLDLLQQLLVLLLQQLDEQAH